WYLDSLGRLGRGNLNGLILPLFLLFANVAPAGHKLLVHDYPPDWLIGWVFLVSDLSGQFVKGRVLLGPCTVCVTGGHGGHVKLPLPVGPRGLLLTPLRALDGAAAKLYSLTVKTLNECGRIKRHGHRSSPFRSRAAHHASQSAARSYGSTAPIPLSDPGITAAASSSASMAPSRSADALTCASHRSNSAAGSS